MNVEDYHAQLKAILDRSKELRDRLPVRIPGYRDPMVPVTMAERDAMVDAYTDTEMDRIRQPIRIRTSDDELDAAIEAVQPDALDQREAVLVAGHDRPVILLTEDERYALVRLLMRLGNRVREMGDGRTLRQLYDEDRRMTPGMMAFTLVADMGYTVDKIIPALLDEMIERLEQRQDEGSFHNANALREAREKLWKPKTRAN